MTQSATRLRALVCVLAVLLVASGAQSVSADETETNLYLNITGVTAIGAVNDRLLAGTLSLLGCTWRDLGPATLATSYALHGTSGNDTIRVVDTLNFVWCNLILQPPTQNGHAFKVYGGDGDDIIYGGGYAPFSGNPNWIYGEAGNDTLYLGAGGAQGDGGPGDDHIYGGDSTSDVLLGGDGNDALCEHANVQPLEQDGGDGVDSACSPTAASGQYTNIELTSCLPCGLGY